MDGKLVRDKIPEIIQRSGETPILSVASGTEYSQRLELKLDEEVAEFHASRNLEELADILEVVYALCNDTGHAVAELEQLFADKRKERGGFFEGVVLLGSK